MIYLEAKHFAIVKHILKKYPYKFYVFGSRATGNHRKLSDLDLAVYENLPLNIKSQLDEEFEESDLPFKVDIVDLTRCDPKFTTLIIKDLLLFEE